MKKTTLYLLTILFGFLLAACSPEQISDAIEDCQNDPECYEIVDQAIEEELEARGITGGIMTTDELTDVYDLMSQYYLDTDSLYTYELYPLFLLYLNAARWHNPDQADLVNELEQKLHALYGRDEFVNELFNFEAFNEDDKQYVVVDDVRYILFKTGRNTFQYEVYADQIYVFTLDTELNRVYLDEELLNIDTSVVDDLLNGVIAFDNVNFTVDNDVIYYDFEYDGYLVGAYDLTTYNRFEVIFYPNGFDIYEYDGLLSLRSRMVNEEFVGTFTEFMTYITDPETMFPSQFRPFMETLQSYYDGRTIDYPIDFTQES